MIYTICKQIIILKNYETKEEYQETLDIFLELKGITPEQHKELSELLQKM